LTSSWYNAEPSGTFVADHRGKFWGRVGLVRLLILLLVVAISPLAMARDVLASDAPFTIVVLPDTQNYTRYDQPDSRARIFRQQTTWIANRVASQNIVFVSHEGDLVEHGGERLVEWRRAHAAMRLLDGVVPYATVPGNRDYDVVDDPDGSASRYLEYFGPQRYQNYHWYGGASPNQLNQYQIFQAGPWTFLHLGLELEVPNSAITWAQNVLDRYPHLPTIVTTHTYLRPGVGRTTWTMYGRNSGEQIWQKLIRPNPQVFMVLNGHSTQDDGEYHQISSNSAGLPVYEMIANYQSYPNGGDGYLRLLQFQPVRNRILVRTYSPSLKQSIVDANSHFTLPIKFASRFKLPASVADAFNRDAGQGWEGVAGGATDLVPGMVVDVLTGNTSGHVRSSQRLSLMRRPDWMIPPNGPILPTA
jgi:hypothetical protein